MSIKTYPAHQFVVEFDTDYYESPLFYITPSFSGYLKHIRLKMMKRNAVNSNGRAIIVIWSIGDNADFSYNKCFICMSSEVKYNDIGNAINENDYYHTFVRFDFDEETLVAGKKYGINIYSYDYVLPENGFVGYCLDYNFPVNQTSKPNSPFTNARLAAEIYMMKDYYDFE
jgi:hypothetical protein